MTRLEPFKVTKTSKGMVKGEYPTWARGHHLRAGWGLCECGCGQRVRGRFVQGHRARLPQHRNWKGGVTKNDQGYLLQRIPTHPNASPGGYVLQHRYVMECALLRLLTKDESVHHINGDRADNRIENLQLRKRNHGQGQKFQCLECGSHNIDAVEL